MLVSDGADTSEASLADALLGMKAEKLPVFTVGVGSEQLPRDIQIDRGQHAASRAARTRRCSSTSS